METISMTFSDEQIVRICAYSLCGHAGISPFSLGDYWNYTEEESRVIVEAHKLWDAFTDAWEAAGLEIPDIPKTTKKKFITAALKQAAN